MPRRSCRGYAGVVFHVMNRAARRLPLFSQRADYELFEEALVEGAMRVPMRTLAYCIMPNHWHLLLWPLGDDHLTHFMRWTTARHAQRWHLARGSVGTGAVYQGRFKAIPVQDDGHFLTAVRYVEQNPVRAGLVAHAADWPWSSACHGPARRPRPVLADWPVSCPVDRAHGVDGEATSTVAEVRRCIREGLPFGDQDWTSETALRLGLAARLRGRGRPRAGGCRLAARAAHEGRSQSRPMRVQEAKTEISPDPDGFARPIGPGGTAARAGQSRAGELPACRSGGA